MLPKHPVLPHFCCGARGMGQFHDWETEAQLPLCLQMGFTSAASYFSFVSKPCVARRHDRSALECSKMTYLLSCRSCTGLGSRRLWDPEGWGQLAHRPHSFSPGDARPQQAARAAGWAHGWQQGQGVGTRECWAAQLPASFHAQLPGEPTSLLLSACHLLGFCLQFKGYGSIRTRSLDMLESETAENLCPYAYLLIFNPIR